MKFNQVIDRVITSPLKSLASPRMTRSKARKARAAKAALAEENALVAFASNSSGNHHRRTTTPSTPTPETAVVPYADRFVIALDERCDLVESSGVGLDPQDQRSLLPQGRRAYPSGGEEFEAYFKHLIDTLERPDGENLVPVVQEILSDHLVPKRIVSRVNDIWIERSLSRPNQGNPGRGFLGKGTMEVVEVGNVTLWCFYVKDETAYRERRFCTKVPAAETAHEWFHGNAGLENRFLLDGYDFSGHSQNCSFYRRFTINHASQFGIMILFALSYGDGAVSMLEEWYDRAGRFVRPPSVPAHPVDDPNRMDVDNIEGQDVVGAPRHYNSEEEEEYYGEVAEMSQQV